MNHVSMNDRADDLVVRMKKAETNLNQTEFRAMATTAKIVASCANVTAARHIAGASPVAGGMNVMVEAAAEIEAARAKCGRSGVWRGAKAIKTPRAKMAVLRLRSLRTVPAPCCQPSSERGIV